jgi:hypothetical protein
MIFPAATFVFFDDFIMKKTASFASESPAAPAQAPKPGTFSVKAHAVLAVAPEQAAIAGGESYSDLRRAIEEMDG